MPACRREIEVYRVVMAVLDEVTVSYLAAKHDDADYFLVCFGFHRWQDICLASCTHRQNHGCACNQRQAGHLSHEQQQLRPQRGLLLAEVRHQQYLRTETYWGGVGSLLAAAAGSYGSLKVPWYRRLA